MTAPEEQLDTLRERIESSDGISDADREALGDFDDRMTLLNSNYSAYRHVKLLRHVTILAEKVGGVADALTDKDAAEELVRWINRNYDNEETNQDYRVALKVFGRRASEENGDEPPDSLDWIPSGTSKNYDPAPEPSEMLDWNNDILPMIEETSQKRDAAAIALAFDGGLRGFEFRDLTVGDITDHKYGLQVTVDGKQGKRTVTLIPSVPYVNEWLDAHPGADNRDAPLWSRVDEPEEISYRMLSKIFQQAAARAWDVDIGERGTGALPKPVTLTNFRKSSASYHASKGLSQAYLEDRYGWVRGSTTAGRYVTVFGKDADNELARLHGIEVEEEEPEEIGPVPCPRCDEPNKRTAHFCSRCGQALRVGAVRYRDEIQQEVGAAKTLADLEDIEGLTPEQIEAIAEDDAIMSQLIQARTGDE